MMVDRRRRDLNKVAYLFWLQHCQRFCGCVHFSCTMRQLFATQLTPKKYWGGLVDKNNPNKNNPKNAGLTYLRKKTSTPEIGYFLLFLNFAYSTQATQNHKACNLGGTCGVARSQQRRYAPDSRRAMRPRAVISPEVPADLSALGPPGHARACLGCVWAVWWGVLGRFGPFLAASRSIQLFLGRFCLPLAVSSDKIRHKRPSK